MQRQFTINQLLDQLKTGSVQRSYEYSAHAVKKSRIFADVSASLSSVLVDAEYEAVQVANILACIKPAQVGIDENVPVILVSDYDESIIRWAAKVIEHACSQLLTEENKVKPEILNAFPCSISSELTPEDLVLSYLQEIKLASTQLAKQKLKHVNSSGALQNLTHIENVCIVFDSRTQESVLQEMIRQAFNKRTPSDAQTDKMSASVVALRRNHYGRASWALNWHNPSQNPVTATTQAIKVRP